MKKPIMARVAEDKAAEEAEIKTTAAERSREHVKSMLNEFKAACIQGYCLRQIKEPSGDIFEFWLSKSKQVIIIQIYAGHAGFEVFKPSPDPDLNSTIEFINS